MSSDTDSEYEESEHLVYADFNNQLMPQQLSDPNAAIKIIGFESKHPIAEVNGGFFKGTYDLSMGTNVFFEKDPINITGDPMYETTCKQKYKYYDKTEKILQFQRIYVEPKPDNSENDKEEEKGKEGEKEDDAQKVTIKKEPSVKINLNYKNAIRNFCNGE